MARPGLATRGAPHPAELLSDRELRISYLRKVRRTGKLVKPDTSRARSVIVYRPGPRKRCAGSQLRVYAPHGRGATRVAKRRSAGRTPGFVSRTRMARLRGWSSQMRMRT